MGLPVLVMGRSGSGKSASLRKVNKKWFVVNVNKKPLPFKNNDNLLMYNCDDFIKIKAALLKAYEQQIKSCVIDDAGYLLTSKFMAGHRQAKGNSQFDLYNEIGDNYYSLIKFIVEELPEDMIVYVIMHEEMNDLGYVKPKTIGKLLDDKVCVEGMFTIVLHSMKLDGKYVFATNTDGLDVTKSPIGMFDLEYIDNDLQNVDNTIREYYGK
jgi:hypothetical protein